MEINPVCAMFPELPRDSREYKHLLVSIQRNGQFEPIVLDSQGRVLDGRNRLAICIDLGIEPKFVQFDDLDLGVNEDGEPIGEAEYAFDKNIWRRHLTDDQKAIALARFEEFMSGGFEKRKTEAGRPKESATNSSQINDASQHSELTGAENGSKESATNSSQPSELPKKREPYTRKILAQKAGISEHKAQQALSVARSSPALSDEVAAGSMRLRDAVKRVNKGVNPKRQPTKNPDTAIKHISKIIDKMLPVLDDLDRTYFIGKLQDLIAGLHE